MHIRSKRTVVEHTNNGRRWTVKDERKMVHLRRHNSMTFEQIADRLERNPEAIKLRFEKLMNEHGEGHSDAAEVVRWFNLGFE
jgi:hypothetical protein